MSRKPDKRVTGPVPVHETVRRQLFEALTRGPRSAKELSFEAGVPEREVHIHLEHVRKSLTHADLRLAVKPAECRKCGFVFSKRDRLTKPGKCPRCRGTSIRSPLFSIQE